jgi:hypothetical protein
MRVGVFKSEMLEHTLSFLKCPPSIVDEFFCSGSLPPNKILKYLEGALPGRASWAGQFGVRYPGQRETSCHHFAYLGGG